MFTVIATTILPHSHFSYHAGMRLPLESVLTVFATTVREPMCLPGLMSEVRIIQASRLQRNIGVSDQP